MTDTSTFSNGHFIRQKRRKRFLSSLTKTILIVNIVAFTPLAMGLVSIQRYKNNVMADGVSALSFNDNITTPLYHDFILIFIIGLAIMILMSIYLAHVLGQPLKQLARATDRIRRDPHLRGTIPDYTSRNDEIGDLSAALHDLTDALKQRIHTIESFAADVSHELKNPLASLRSAIEALDAVKDPEKQKKLHHIIHHDLIRMDRLISDTAALSRLDAALLNDISAPIDLIALIHTAVEHKTLLIDRLREDGMKNPPHITIDALTDTPLTVWGNADRLHQVFDNIISNALSFSPPDGVITICIDHEPSVAVIHIDDKGPGIPDTKLNSIFKRFYTDRPFDDIFGNNSGLGLSISRQIIHAHQGRIHANNRRDDDGDVIGARFSVFIPLMDKELM